jgi:hypothetical protein
MCEGGRLVADFVAGTSVRPTLPEVADEHLTATADGLWVVWAYKLAWIQGDLFVPMTGRSGYPADAKATCRVRGARPDHDAPDPKCTCGFHALSNRMLPGLVVRDGLSELTVALSGRVLAFEWASGGVLWRAERQTVVRIGPPPPSDLARSILAALSHPDDPEGRLAVIRPVAPRDSGPVRLNLPASAPVVEMCHDDAGWCVGASTLERAPASLVVA